MRSPSEKLFGWLSLVVVTSNLLLTSSSAVAYESDVHFGLTKWLGLKAGFASHEADAIARGDQQVDSGGPQSIDAVLDYGCALPDVAAAKRVQRAHAPSETSVPAPPAQREVVAGSEAARQEIHRIVKEAKGKEGSMLALFGGAMHVYQDSWSNAGFPTVFDGGEALKCSPELALSHPATRGGPDSHKADLTFEYPNDALEMAKASYVALTGFPNIDGRKRSPATWDRLEPMVRSFVNARTKTEKKAWFVAQGIPDVHFMEGTTLPDGSDTWNVRSKPSLLPELTAQTSQQYDVPQDVGTFFDELIKSWITDDDLDKSLRKYLPSESKSAIEELCARLKLLRMRDHGVAAALVHQRARFSRSDLKRIHSLTRDPSVYVHPASLADAMLPLTPKEAPISPLLPYLVREQPGSNNVPRALAIMRLNHLPYDTVALSAERTRSGWKLLNVVVAVDH
ncbi:hypothetical protein AWB77_03908 [Caballeronia fortuita]|uniref:Uncharacterized protein n=1 Tax=Caballeronia fortuita TaxID=1777138 RepID=A0A158CBD9_9BURK|nr:hypothetical protein [Caballeronia fortuita]SAK79693.1 hypothetical protein AWB77_03908 [Caballeronia fortuita]